MGALFALFRDDPASAAALHRSFAAQGFGDGCGIRRPGLHLAAFPPLTGGRAMLAESGDDVLVAAGTLIHKDRTGDGALPALLEALRSGTHQARDLSGCFAVAGRVAGRPVLLSDGAGTFHLYTDGAGTLVSSSFLATASAMGRLTIDPGGVWDYVFLEACHGGGTVFQEVRQVAPGMAPLPDRPCPHRGEGLDQAADRCLTPLRERFATLARLFGDGIDTALSGGFDSRLMLALLRASGARPAIHVYGGQGDADVRIAGTICRGEGLALRHVDKGVWPLPDPSAFKTMVERQFLAMDGLPTDGILDSGADLATRRERCADGRLALNGGGGEVFRNFFHLPDRPLSAMDLVRGFYSQFDPAAGAGGFDIVVWRWGIARRIAASVGVDPDTPMDRPLADAVYPRFRCRWWMGRNASLNARLGPALTPLVDPPAVAEGLAVDPRWKRCGVLEARMITLVDPALARYASAHGPGFDRWPSAAVRIRAALDDHRPFWLRARTHRLKRQPPLPPLLADPWRRALFGHGLDYIHRYVHLDRLRDPRQLARALTLEYLFRRTGPRP